MAEIKGSKMKKGTEGNTTYYWRGGKQFSRSISIFGEPVRSTLTMYTRTRWMGTVNAYKYLKPDIKQLMTLAGNGTTSYNLFVKSNMPTSSVFLTKEQGRNGGAVVEDYVISVGTLTPTIEHSLEEGQIKTSILLGDLVIDDKTTVGEFSRAVTNNNFRLNENVRRRNKDKEKIYRYGDGIIVVISYQKINAETGIPYITSGSFEMILSETQETPLWDIVPSWAFVTVDGKLGTSRTIDGAMAYVHVRKTPDHVEVSTQRLVSTNSLLDQYSSKRAFDEAVRSFGGINRTSVLEPDMFLDEATGDSEGGSGTTGGTGSDTNGGGTTPEQVTITAVASPSNGGSVSGGGTYAKDASVTLKATASSGYTFSRWSDGNTNAQRTVIASANATYTAQFTQNGGGSQGGYDSGN